MSGSTKHAMWDMVIPGVLLIWMGLAAPAFGQLTLEQFAPAHGATDVDTGTAITLTFSASLDATAAFEVSGGFFLGIEISPSPGEPGTVTLGNGDRTVTITLTLQDDTRYSVLLSGARSTTGAPLDHRYAFTFTTGATLPTGSVSGAVSLSGGDTFGALVGLFPVALFAADGEGEDGNRGLGFLAVTVVTDATGAYTIDFVPPGRYLVGALKDVDQDGQPLPGIAGEGLGFYNAEANHVPDVLDLQDGEAAEDLDFPMLPVTTATARATFPDAEAFARSMHADASLAGIQSADLSPEGESTSWFYIFYSPSTGDTLGVGTISQFLVPAPVEEEEDGLGFDPADPLPNDWIDSQVAMTTAENTGGAEFRAGHPDAFVSAALFNATLGGFGGTALAPAGWPRGGHSLQEHLRTAGLAEGTPIWLIFYFTFEEDPLVIGIDAQSGEVLVTIGLATTARFSLNAAHQAATLWHSDAGLVALENSEHAGPLDAGGRAAVWYFAYYSPAGNTALRVTTTGGVVISDAVEEINPNDLPSLDPLPGGWIDSDAAAAEAEANSSDFRSQHADAVVTALLSRGQRSSGPVRSVWRFTYASQQDAASLVVDVDASIGSVIVSAEYEAGGPEAIVLYQNYPNPFNPETTLTYEVPQAGQVELTIYNALGQKVRTLANGVLEASGLHTATWNGVDDGGRPVASGIYFYTLPTSDASPRR